jgi:hypothetical protein
MTALRRFQIVRNQEISSSLWLSVLPQGGTDHRRQTFIHHPCYDFFPFSSGNLDYTRKLSPLWSSDPVLSRRKILRWRRCPTPASEWGTPVLHHAVASVRTKVSSDHAPCSMHTMPRLSRRQRLADGGCASPKQKSACTTRNSSLSHSGQLLYQARSRHLARWAIL